MSMSDSVAGGTGAALVRGMLDALRNAHLDPFDRLITADYVAWFAGESEPVRGLENYKELARLFLVAFPDLHAVVHDLFECGDRVVARLTYHGTHLGDFQGTPSTGETIAFDSIEIYRVAGDRIAEEWVSFDELRLLRQIGAISGDHMEPN